MIELREQLHLPCDLPRELFVAGIQWDSLDGVQPSVEFVFHLGTTENTGVSRLFLAHFARYQSMSIKHVAIASRKKGRNNLIAV